MLYRIHIPSYPLNQFIENFVYYKGYNPVHSIDRFLPDGNIHVVFELTENPKYIYDNHSLKEIQSCRRVWFSGIREKFITIPSGRDSEMFIIYFKKGKAYPFLEMPVHELTDFVVDAELVLSNEILNMREGLISSEKIVHKFQYAEKFILNIFAKKLIVNPFIEFAVKQIISAPNSISITEISDNSGYSHKHLVKMFKDHVGLTPKSFLKVMRFQKAIEEMTKGSRPVWSHIALESGYYDQAHFINDFKQFSGFTPEQYANMNSEFTNYVAVG